MFTKTTRDEQGGGPGRIRCDQAAYLYAPWHRWEAVYDADSALMRGTAFPALSDAFAGASEARSDQNRRMLLREIQKLDFLALDIRMFINTHPDCEEAIVSYNDCLKKRRAANEKYLKLFGAPSAECGAGRAGAIFPHPWPWEEEDERYVDV